MIFEKLRGGADGVEPEIRCFRLRCATARPACSARRVEAQRRRAARNNLFT